MFFQVFSVLVYCCRAYHGLGVSVREGGREEGGRKEEGGSVREKEGGCKKEGGRKRGGVRENQSWSVSVGGLL